MRDDEIFGDLRALRADMLRWARKYGPDAEDLVQAALVNMWTYRHTAPANKAELAPWAQTILRNVARTKARGARLQTEPMGERDFSAIENPETQTYCRQVLGRCSPTLLDAVLRCMPPASSTTRARWQRERARLAELAA